MAYGPRESRPRVLHGAHRQPSNGANLPFFDGINNGSRHIFTSDNDRDFWEAFAGAELEGSSADGDLHVFDILFDGPDSRIIVDDTTVASGDVGSQGLDGFRFGGNFNAGNLTPVDALEILYYPMDKSSQASAIRGYLNREYNVLG